MPAGRPITFVVTTYGTGEVLENNFLASPCLRHPHRHQILVQRDYISAAKAYNRAIDRADNDLMIFAHQDVIFLEPWLSQLEQALNYLDAEDVAWGVLGCYGRARDGSGQGCIYSPGRGLIGLPFERPALVRTLDEIVLIFKKSSGLRFDDRLPHFHMYAADICMRAESRGLANYVVPALCIHNTNQYIVLPDEFYECYRYVKRVWKDRLPIQTVCLEMTRFDSPMYKRRLLEAYLKHVRHKTFLAPRVSNVSQLIEQATAAVPGLQEVEKS